jgi:hypothetical protein
MATPEQREQESRENPETKFLDQRDEERIERDRLAENVDDGFVEADEDDT